jgi:integration host factor subunit beta
MNKNDLIDRLVRENDLSKAEVKFLVNRIFQNMKDALAKGNRVEIRGLGTFTVKNDNAYAGRTREPAKPLTSNLKTADFPCPKKIKRKG